MVIDSLLGTFSSTTGIGLLSGIFALATFIPYLAVTVRRLHDTDRSGWWLLLAFIPIIGGIILLVFMIQDSQPETNRFGPNPKATGGLAAASQERPKADPFQGAYALRTYSSIIRSVLKNDPLSAIAFRITSIQRSRLR